MQINQVSLTRRPGSQSPERCGRSMSPPGLRFGSKLRAHNHRTVPCRHSTAGWPPGRGRALPQCIGYSNHNNLRGHNISAHRRHTPHIKPRNTSQPQWGCLSASGGSYKIRPHSAHKPRSTNIKLNQKQARKQQNEEKLERCSKQEFKQQFQTKLPNRSSYP